MTKTGDSLLRKVGTSSRRWILITALATGACAEVGDSEELESQAAASDESAVALSQLAKKTSQGHVATPEPAPIPKTPSQGHVATPEPAPIPKTPSQGHVATPEPAPIPKTNQDKVADPAFDFGHGARFITGNVPTLVARFNTQNSFQTFHDDNYYRSLFFGGRSVSSYIDEMSNNLASVIPAVASTPLWGPWALPRPRPEPTGNADKDYQAAEKWAREVRTQIIINAANEGFPFADFDRNHDGKVTNDELLVAAVIARDTATVADSGGANREMDSMGQNEDPGCYRPVGSSVAVCLKIGTAGEDVGLATLTHELIHSWDVPDLYGVNGLNYRATLMSNTHDNLFHLDPWNKMRFGWELPEVHDLSRKSNCRELKATTTVNAGTSSIVLYDSRRGTSEFFILEHRRPVSFDAFTHAQGVAIWHVKLNPDRSLAYGNAFIAPNKDGLQSKLAAGSDDVIDGDQRILRGPNNLLESVPAGDDAFGILPFDNLVSAPTGEYGHIGNNSDPTPYWTQANGEAELRWSDNTSSGVLIRVGEAAGDSLSVRWRRVGDPEPGAWSQASCNGAVTHPLASPAVFDPAAYLELYGDLRAAFGDDHDAALQHWLTYGVNEGRISAPWFDARYYLALHGDLVNAFGADNFAAAATHFVQYGLKEGRASAPAFDVAFYLHSWPDLINAFGYDNHPAALNHFRTFGARERRVSSPVFQLDYYLSTYGDLENAFGSNPMAAITHYYSYGTAEGRASSSVFDVRYYLSQYGDLSAAFGEDFAAARNHFLTSGLREGRRASPTFDVAAYLRRYGDLQAAFGVDNYRAALEHWFAYGRHEGRNAAP